VRNVTLHSLTEEVFNVIKQNASSNYFNVSNANNGSLLKQSWMCICYDMLHQLICIVAAHTLNHKISLIVIIVVFTYKFVNTNVIIAITSLFMAEISKIINLRCMELQKTSFALFVNLLLQRLSYLETIGKYIVLKNHIVAKHVKNLSKPDLVYNATC